MLIFRFDMPGPVGQPVAETQTDIASGITTEPELYADYDEFSRPQSLTHLDGTATLTEYACCGGFFHSQHAVRPR